MEDAACITVHDHLDIRFDEPAPEEPLLGYSAIRDAAGNCLGLAVSEAPAAPT
jgi:hypothetical protein